MDRPILAVDFDGTITNVDTFPNKPTIGDVNSSCITILRVLWEMGATIVLNTCRGGEKLDEAVECCEEWGIPIDYINCNPIQNVDKFNEDCRKIYADYYIDDRNIGGFIGWENVFNIVIQHPYFKDRSDKGLRLREREFNKNEN